MSNTELERIAQLEVVASDNKKDIAQLESTTNENKNEITKLQIIAKENKEDIVKLKDETSAFYRLAVNQDVLTSTLNTIVKDNKEQMKDFSATLHSVNINLTNLNTKSDDMREDLNRFESELKSVKDGNKKIEDRGKFDMLNFLTVECPKYLGLAILAFLLAYFGLK